MPTVVLKLFTGQGSERTDKAATKSAPLGRIKMLLCVIIMNAANIFVQFHLFHLLFILKNIGYFQKWIG